MAEAPKGGGMDNYGSASVWRNLMEFFIGTPIRMITAGIGAMVMTVLGK
jgi:hypothetical protein